MEREALEMALEALVNSVDLVVEDAYNAEQLYGSYPTRQARIGGLKMLADKHREAITKCEAALAQPAPVQEFGLTRERFNALEAEITTLQSYWQSALKEVVRLNAAQPALDKLEQAAFDAWWDTQPRLNETNPCSVDSFEYWAWEGWHAALAQPAQEPFAGIKMWVGRTQIMRCLTQTELHNAVDPWQHLERNAAVCIRALKEKNRD